MSRKKKPMKRSYQVQMKFDAFVSAQIEAEDFEQAVREAASVGFEKIFLPSVEVIDGTHEVIGVYEG